MAMHHVCYSTPNTPWAQPPALDYIKSIRSPEVSTGRSSSDRTLYFDTSVSYPGLTFKATRDFELTRISFARKFSVLS